MKERGSENVQKRDQILNIPHCRISSASLIGPGTAQFAVEKSTSIVLARRGINLHLEFRDFTSFMKRTTFFSIPLCTAFSYIFFRFQPIPVIESSAVVNLVEMPLCPRSALLITCNFFNPSRYLCVGQCHFVKYHVYVRSLCNKNSNIKVGI